MCLKMDGEYCDAIFLGKDPSYRPQYLYEDPVDTSFCHPCLKKRVEMYAAWQREQFQDVPGNTAEDAYNKAMNTMSRCSASSLDTTGKRFTYDNFVVKESTVKIRTNAGIKLTISVLAVGLITMISLV